MDRERYEREVAMATMRLGMRVASILAELGEEQVMQRYYALRERWERSPEWQRFKQYLQQEKQLRNNARQDGENGRKASGRGPTEFRSFGFTELRFTGRETKDHHYTYGNCSAPTVHGITSRAGAGRSVRDLELTWRRMQVEHSKMALDAAFAEAIASDARRHLRTGHA